MSRKLKVAVLMGGDSREHEISLKSGQEVINNLTRSKYNAIPVIIKRDSAFDVCLNLKKSKVDICFIALHGTFGEDGQIQAILDSLNIPYTGSGFLSSSLCMDKWYSKLILNHYNLLTPNGFVITKDDIPISAKFPVFVKPADQGSSIGASIAKNPRQLEKSINLAFEVTNRVLVEEFIEGLEVTCAILGQEKPIALPLVEIVSKKTFFDYESKYDPHLSDEICPARIPKSLTFLTQSFALKAYKALSCQVFARVDMILSDKKIYILEINTIPGLTAVSLFPKAAKEAGMTFPDLLDEIIKHSLSKY